MLKPHAEVDDNEIINVDVPSYTSEFEKLINITPNRVQANYVMWRAVSSTVEYLNDRIRDRQLKYLMTQKGQTKRESQPIECIISVAEKLPVAIGALYVRNYVSKDVKKNAVQMISDIQNQFKKILQTVDWMDEGIRKNAIEKVAAIASHIPDELLDDSKLEEFYEKLQFDENSSYLENIMDVNLFNEEYSFSQLRKPVNKTDWVLYADVAVINARYYPLKNSMSFTAGILQDALFNIDRPKYLNYGAIGFVIGHEICHSFDDIGRKFDKDGSVVNWWASSTEKKYLEKVD
ncbi:neprilysin-2-like [Cydia pomonella]|uniref:neprilysin-2-like n=1 Tax=Cydia pomonella TaxID=82600 RepID=UPI002ADE8789|nr:neprilysin-2-like [Cydia pomonella]